MLHKAAVRRKAPNFTDPVEETRIDAVIEPIIVEVGQVPKESKIE